jgi:hypothetical protein
MLHAGASRVQKGENLQQTVQFGSAGTLRRRSGQAADRAKSAEDKRNQLPVASVSGTRSRSRRIFYSLAKEPRRRSIRVTFRISDICVWQSCTTNNVRTRDLLSLIINLSRHRRNSSPRLGLAEAFFVERQEPRPAPRAALLLCLYPSLFSVCHTDTLVVKNGSAQTSRHRS